MDFNTKRQYKHNAKKYGTISQFGLGLFTITAILALIFGLTGNDKIGLTLGLTSIVLFILSMITAIYGESMINKRKEYLANIKRYKQYRYFQLILEQLKLKNYDQVVIMYDTLLVKGAHKDFLFGYIVAILSNSDNLEHKALGEKKVKEYADFYDHNKITF